MINDYKHKISSKGWIEIENIHSNSELLSIATSLGHISPHPNGEKIASISPKPKSQSIAGTLSNRFGFGTFPMHTDTAFWPKPARYVLLSSTEPSNTKTLIFHIDNIWNQLSKYDTSLAKRAIFIVKTIHGQHYTSLEFKENGQMGFRYDPCTMFPCNTSAKKFQIIFENIIESIQPVEIDWSGNKALIFDNWCTLHARTSSKKNEMRILKRIYIN